MVRLGTDAAKWASLSKPSKLHLATMETESDLKVSPVLPAAAQNAPKRSATDKATVVDSCQPRRRSIQTQPKHQENRE